MSADQHHAPKWKHDGVRVIPANTLDPNTAQSPGMDRKAAINFARVGAQKIWAGTVTVQPNAKTGAHHHGALESVIYVVRGRARMRWGERLEFVAEADPGDAGTGGALERVRAAMPRVASEPTGREAPRPPGPAAEELRFSLDADEPAEAENVFAGLEGGADALLLVDGNGLRLGGGLRSPDGKDVADTVAAQLSGVAREAARTARLLALGEWKGLAIEAPGGSCYLVAPTPETLLFTARGPDLPMGRVARLAERAAAEARRWLEELR